jgi:hypothetical protein
VGLILCWLDSATETDGDCIGIAETDGMSGGWDTQGLLVGLDNSDSKQGDSLGLLVGLDDIYGKKEGNKLRLLWETAVSVAATKTTSALTTTVASVAATVGRVLLLSGGVDAAWELLVDGHAELLDVCQLAVHCGQAGGLALHCLGLGWGRSNKLIFN